MSIRCRCRALGVNSALQLWVVLCSCGSCFPNLVFGVSGLAWLQSVGHEVCKSLESISIRVSFIVCRVKTVGCRLELEYRATWGIRCLTPHDRKPSLFGKRARTSCTPVK